MFCFACVIDGGRIAARLSFLSIRVPGGATESFGVWLISRVPVRVLKITNFGFSRGE